MKKLLLFACLSAFFGCSKDENNGRQGTYESNGTIQYYEVSMIVKGSIINDGKIITDYLKRREGVLTVDFPKKVGIGTISEQIKLNFSNSTVTQTVSGSERIIRYNVLGEKSDVVILEQQDSIQVSQGIDTGALNCSNVFLKTVLYPDTYLCSNTPGAQLCTVKPKLALLKVAGGLSIPYLGVMFTRGSDDCGVTFSNMKKILDLGFQGQLGATDTVLIQMATAPLHKK